MQYGTVQHLTGFRLWFLSSIFSVKECVFNPVVSKLGQVLYIHTYLYIRAATSGRCRYLFAQFAWAQGLIPNFALYLYLYIYIYTTLRRITCAPEKIQAPALLIVIDTNFTPHYIGIPRKLWLPRARGFTVNGTIGLLVCIL